MKQQGCEGFIPPETHPLAGAAKAWVEEGEKTATMSAEAPEKHWSMRHDAASCNQSYVQPAPGAGRIKSRISQSTFLFLIVEVRLKRLRQPVKSLFQTTSLRKSHPHQERRRFLLRFSMSIH